MTSPPLQGLAWMGTHVAVLTPDSKLDPAVMTRIVDDLDKLWNYYRTCGPALSYGGANGISITQTYFNDLYFDITTQCLFDQLLAYELAQNFWFYGSQLSYPSNDPVATAFDIFMRFQSLDSAHIPGGQFNSIPYAQFEAQVESLVDIYESDPTTYTWQTTLGSDAGGVTFVVDGGYVVDGGQTYGTSDLLASFLFRLVRDYGGDAADGFVAAFWQAAGDRPPAASTQDAVDNFVLAACAAAQANLTREFSEQFRWPVSSGATREAQLKYGNPVAPQP